MDINPASINLNNLNLMQLLELAKTIPYVDPEESEDQWNNDQVIYKAISIAIHTPIQLRAGLIMVEMFGPLKLIFKSIIRRYIKYYQPNFK